MDTQAIDSTVFNSHYPSSPSREKLCRQESLGALTQVSNLPL